MSTAEAPTSPALPVLAPGARFEGTLSFRGAARVEGELTGQILARGTLHVGEQAVVKAQVEAEEVVVAGVVQGDITATRRLQLLPSARVEGQVRTRSLSLADGCTLDGACEMITGLSPSATAG